MNYISVFGLLLLLSWGALAQNTVYRSIDENGVVSFSDKPPKNDETAEVFEIDTPRAQPASEYLRHLEAMRTTTDKIVANRRAREQHQAKMRELDALARLHEGATTPEYSNVVQSYPVHGQAQYLHRSLRGWGITPWPSYSVSHPALTPRVYPSARPPFRLRPHSARNNAQLMRPIVSDR